MRLTDRRGKRMKLMDKLPSKDDQQVLPDAESHSKQDWERRCVVKMRAIQPDIDVIEATQLAIAMWSIERFRKRGPEAMAQMMFSNGAIRPSRT